MLHPRRAKAHKNLKSAGIRAAVNHIQFCRICIKRRLRTQADIDSFVFDQIAHVTKRIQTDVEDFIFVRVVANVLRFLRQPNERAWFSPAFSYRRPV